MAGDKAIIDYIRYNIRSQIFAKSLPMPIVIGNLKRLELLQTKPELKDRLWVNALKLQKGLKEKGFESEGILGFRQSAKEIVRIVKEEKADMLVLGAHGHTGLKDFIYGETINAVRHEMKIPVLVVHL